MKFLACILSGALTAFLIYFILILPELGTMQQHIDGHCEQIRVARLEERKVMDAVQQIHPDEHIIDTGGRFRVRHWLDADSIVAEIKRRRR